MSAPDRRQRLFDKIMARVVIQANGCWLWIGPDSGDGRGGGYGRMCVDGATMAVHIVMWIIRNGPIPPKKQLDHNCPGAPNRKCCNPDHLDLVTHLKNQRLRAKRQRLARVA